MLVTPHYEVWPGRHVTKVKASGRLCVFLGTLPYPMPWGHCPQWYGIPSSFKVTACHIIEPPLYLHLSKCSYEMLSNKGLARLQECMRVAHGHLPASTPQPQQYLTSSHMPSPRGFLLPCKVMWRLWKGQRYTLGDREGKDLPLLLLPLNYIMCSLLHTQGLKIIHSPNRKFQVPSML